MESKETALSPGEQVLANRYFEYLVGAKDRMKTGVPMVEALTSPETAHINLISARYGTNRDTIAIVEDAAKQYIKVHGVFDSLTEPVAPKYKFVPKAPVTSNDGEYVEKPQKKIIVQTDVKKPDDDDTTPKKGRGKARKTRLALDASEEASVLSQFDQGAKMTDLAVKYNVQPPYLATFLRENGREVKRGRQARPNYANVA